MVRLDRIFSIIKEDFFAWVELIICAWPESHVGRELRSFYWKRKYHLKGSVYIGRMAKIYGDKKTLFLGDHFRCGENVEINFCTSKGIYIGHDVAMARGVYIRAGNHKFDRLDVPIWHQGHNSATLEYLNRTYSIIIEDDVWIGANVIILSGAKVGKGAVLAAGSVVSTEIPSFSIVVGNPGRIIGNRQKLGI